MTTPANSRPEHLDGEMPGHGGAGGTQEHLRPQVAFVEQLNEYLVVSAGVGVGEDEALQVGFTVEPGFGSVAKDLPQVVEVGGRNGIADLIGTGRVPSQTEHDPDLVAKVFVVDRRSAKRAHEMLEGDTPS
jgi:hypothetical protein